VSLRHQLPVWSPVSGRAVGAALLAGLTGGRRRGAAGLERVTRILSAEYGHQSFLLTDSGTSALSLAIAASGPVGHRLVALPAWGCYDLVTAVIGAGAQALFYDVLPETLGPDPTSFAAALARRPTAVVLVHYFGIPVDVASFRAATDEIGALLIEDAAQAAGGEIGGQPLGRAGSMAVVSFGRGKGRTGGGGGALLVNDPRFGHALESIRSGLAPAGPGIVGSLKLLAQWIFGQPAWYGIPARMPWLQLGETIYHPPWPPSGMPPANATALAETWSIAVTEERQRRARAGRWLATLAGRPGARPIEILPGGAPGWLRFPIVGPGLSAWASAGPRRRLGLMAGYPGPLPRVPALHGRTANPGPFPGAERLTTDLCTLPTHGLLSAADEAAIVAALDEVGG